MTRRLSSVLLDARTELCHEDPEGIVAVVQPRPPAIDGPDLAREQPELLGEPEGLDRVDHPDVRHLDASFAERASDLERHHDAERPAEEPVGRLHRELVEHSQVVGDPAGHLGGHGSDRSVRPEEADDRPVPEGGR